MKRSTRIVSLLLALVMVVGLITSSIVMTSSAAAFYKDVNAEDWFYENVKSLKEMKLMIGYHDGTFRPENDISLAESVTVAARIHAGYTQAPALKQGELWYAVYADYALKNDLLDKAPADYEAAATRLEFAHLLAKSLPTDGLEAINRVPDGAIPDVKGDEAIYLLYRAGVLIGADDEGNFYPERPITRSEAAAIITRMADPSLRMRSGIFASAEVEVDNSGAVKNETAINADGASATVAAGTATEEGATKLELSVTPMAANEANVKLTYPEVMTTYDVHVEGLAADNTVPVLVELETVLKKGLSRSNVALYHVENGETVAMTQVSSLAELDAHNEFYYDQETGKLTVAMATFSEIAVVAEEGWNGTDRNYKWYTDSTDGKYIISSAEDFAGFAALVGGMAKDSSGKYIYTTTDSEGNEIHYDTFANKTVTLAADIDLGGLSNVVWYPVGYQNNKGKFDRTDVAGVAGVTSDVYSFEGTFDGGDHVISNIYQNTWDMFGDYNSGYSGTPNYYKDGMGLFGFVYNGTVKNLTINNFQSDGEFCTTGVVAAYAAGQSNFENIMITASNPRAYNVPNGGVVGYAYDEAGAAVNEINFKNIKVGSSNKITALWGSWDVACGGILGRMGDKTKVNMTSCDVSAVIDVFNDVCGNYQYYQYRYCGMLIGTAGSDSDPADQIANVSFSDCYVRYGDWADYHYCELVSNSIASYTHDYQFSRLQKINNLSEIKSGDLWLKAGNFYLVNGDGSKTCYHIIEKDGKLTQHTHESVGSEVVDGKEVLIENNQVVEIPFKQLYTGYGWGSSPSATGVNVVEYVYSITYVQGRKILHTEYVTNNNEVKKVENETAAAKVVKPEGNVTFENKWVNAASQPIEKIEVGNKEDYILYPTFSGVYTVRWLDEDGNAVYTKIATSNDTYGGLGQPAGPASKYDDMVFDHWEIRNSDGTYTAFSEVSGKTVKQDTTFYPYYIYKGSIGLTPHDDNGDGRVDYYTVEAVGGLNGVVEIPGAVNGVPVTVITDLSSDFINVNISSIIIKDGVQEIGSNAFAMTTGLKEVTIPSSVTSVGQNAFANTLGNWIGKKITITYDGTWEEYQAICDEDWERGLATGTTVICTDGTATLKATEYIIYNDYDWTFVKK